MTPEKEPYEDEIDAESPSSPFLHSSFSSSGGIGGSSRMSSHGGRTISLSTSTSPRVTVVQLSDIGPGSWADVSDDELPMAGRSSAASGSLLAHSDLLPARGHSLTLDSLAANADNACASPRDGISQLSARSEPNFSRHALRPCSPMHYDPMSLTDDYEVLTGAHSVMRPGADSGAGDLSGSRRASDTGPVPNIDHWSSIRETRRNTSSTSSLSAHSHGHTPSRSPSASALASSCSSSASFASVHSSATASASSSTSARPAQSRISPFAPTGIVSPPLSSTQLSPNSFQSPFSLSSGSGPATAAASSRISPRNSGASSRILFGTSNPGSTLTQSTPDAFSFYATSPHSSSSSSLGGSHCATTGASPVTSSPSWARQRARARDGSQSSSSSSSSHRQSLNSTSSAPLTRPRPVLHTYSGASAAVTTTADSQFAGVSSSVLSESALSSSDGYASSVATNDSSARSSIDIQFDRDDMMMVDSVSPSPVPAMGSNRMFSASTSSLGSYTLTHAPSSARTLPMFLEYSNDMGAHHEGETSLNLDDADFSLVRTKTGRDYGYGPANSRASTLATPKESGRSRSRTFGSSEKPWGLKSPQSPSASPVPSPSVSRSVNATAIANSASASTLLSQSASNGQLAYPEAPEKSPTRARVGGASAAFAARTQAFVSNPHPSLHARHRRDSSASNSRPRPRPFGLQQSGSDMEIPKSKGSSVQGLIPNIRALNVAPASPSRPQTILPSFKQRNDGTGSIRIHPETVRKIKFFLSAEVFLLFLSSRFSSALQLTHFALQRIFSVVTADSSV